jgi:hypothetical protein
LVKHLFGISFLLELISRNKIHMYTEQFISTLFIELIQLFFELDRFCCDDRKIWQNLFLLQ